MYLNNKRGIWLSALATAVICLPFAAWADETDEETTSEKQVKVVVRANAVSDDEIEIDLALDADVVKPGKYWIGVVCTELDNELLTAHLDVEQGLVVTEVVEDSPAQKAGLREKDILVQVGEEPLGELKVLVTGIEKVQGEELTLTVVRKGKRKVIQVTPAERPAKFAIGRARVDSEAADEWKMLQEELRKHGAVPKQDEDAKGRDLSMMLVMPGFVMPDQAKDLPSNLEVTITKKGKEDAKITVKKGDKQWNVDAKSLDKLPEDIRPHIQKMLGRGHEMSLRLDTDGFNWALPRDLVAPRVLRRSLQIAPDKVYELHQFEHGLSKDVREKIRNQLKEAHRVLEDARSNVPADALKKIEDELKVLREQLEQLREERTEDE